MVHVHVRLLEVVRRNPTYGVIDKIQNAIIEMHVSLWDILAVSSNHLVGELGNWYSLNAGIVHSSNMAEQRDAMSLDCCGKRRLTGHVKK